MIWSIITAVATLVSMFAYIVTVFYVRSELKGLEKDRYITVTSELFSIWQSRDFMDAQLWLLHQLDVATWEEFVAKHRADVGEIAFHRVGSFYDRVGTLVRMQLIDEKEILSTMGGYAIAVWQKIEPLVREARRIENSVLFNGFEGLLPACHECYVPSLGREGAVRPFELTQDPDRHASKVNPLRFGAVQRSEVKKVAVGTLKALLDKGAAVTVLDVRQAKQIAQDPRRLPHAIYIPPTEIAERYPEIPVDREIVVYCA